MSYYWSRTPHFANRSFRVGPVKIFEGMSLLRSTWGDGAGDIAAAFEWQNETLPIREYIYIAPLDPLAFD